LLGNSGSREIRRLASKLSFFSKTNPSVRLGIGTLYGSVCQLDLFYPNYFALHVASTLRLPKRAVDEF
jgi:hypothetical protein